MRWVLCLVLIAGLSGCSAAPPGPAPSGSPSSAVTGSPVPVPDEFCAVALPQAWQDALSRGRIPHATDESLVVRAVSDDGSSLFADSYRAGKREMVWLREGQRTTVMRLSDPVQQVFGAAFDGRWLVFSIWDEPELNTPWTMYAWDSTASTVPRALGRATGPGVYPYPAVYNGRTFWTLARQPHSSEAHVTDLASGRDRVVASGWIDYPFRFGSIVAWPELSTENMTVSLKAVDIATGEPATLPAELRTPLTRPLFVNGDADTYVWSANDGTRLRAWRAGAADAVTIFAAPQGQYLQWPQVGGPLVTWDNGAAQFVADLRTGSYARLTPEFGTTKLSGDALIVTYAPTGKSANPVLDSTLIRPSQLPALPSCG
jgi:hypothetical protein